MGVRQTTVQNIHEKTDPRGCPNNEAKPSRAHGVVTLPLSLPTPPSSPTAQTFTLTTQGLLGLRMPQQQSHDPHSKPGTHKRGAPLMTKNNDDNEHRNTHTHAPGCDSARASVAAEWAFELAPFARK